MGKEIEGICHEPKIDDLSVAIVEMMEDRKNIPTHERLYRIG
jgi:hypothetical protein